MSKTRRSCRRAGNRSVKPSPKEDFLETQSAARRRKRRRRQTKTDE